MAFSAGGQQRACSPARLDGLTAHVNAAAEGSTGTDTSQAPFPGQKIMVRAPAHLHRHVSCVLRCVPDEAVDLWRNAHSGLGNSFGE
jgi:hypothetical protein